MTGFVLGADLRAGWVSGNSDDRAGILPFFAVSGGSLQTMRAAGQAYDQERVLDELRPTAKLFLNIAIDLPIFFGEQ